MPCHHAPAHPFSQSTPIPHLQQPSIHRNVALVVVVMCCRGELSGEKKFNSMLACNQSIYMIKRFSLFFLFIRHHSPIFPIVAFYIVKREREYPILMILSVSRFDLPFFPHPFVSSLNLHNVLFND